MELRLPKPLEKVLNREPQLHGAVMLSLNEFESWIRLSRTPFFPEYTDHGLIHIQQVMMTSAAIIRDDCWEVVTSGDVACLALAILLHDCALHLPEDGFLVLVDPGKKRPIIDGTGDAAWPQLWADFLGEASRFDARKLIALFGDSEPAHAPNANAQHWTARDRLLIGEFLRRHHSRLAHEVALWGVPGPGTDPLRLRGVSPDIADIAGHVARSHGQPIRSCLPYLAQKYDLRAYKGIHAVFLMAVVRTADYLQVQSDRAPKQILQIHKLSSPVSQGEWSVHAAVRDIRSTHEDPEAIFIDASPADVKTFLKLKRLIEAIQMEFDSSWAALGEVYGRYEGLNLLGLGLRRVRSNLDDLSAFSKTVPYIPCKAAFQAAEADLLKLLVRPLYGEERGIGVRELIQNGVDACRELRDHLQQHPPLVAPKQEDLEADVVVTLSEDEAKKPGWVEVADKGIGMTAETVRDYFLKAGASFRNSDAWRKAFEDASGKSRVLRSGRFGVGVLAAFLLGDEVQVSTRYVDAPADAGVSFSATIDSSEIELRRVARPVGTTIRIKISDDDVWESLTGFKQSWEEARETRLRSWDWYCLPDPEVKRIFKREKKVEELKQQFTLPSSKSTLPSRWHSISHPDYLDIQWTYEKSPRLTCNGIRVMEPREWSAYDYFGEKRDVRPLWETHGLVLRCPNVSLFDPDGHLPLLLQRNGLATPAYPFHEELRLDVVRDLMAFILLRAPTAPLGDAVAGEPYKRLYEGFRTKSNGLTTFCVPGGTSFVDPWHFAALKPSRLLLVPTTSDVPKALSEPTLFSPGYLLPFAAPSGSQQFRAWFRCNMGLHKDDLFGPATELKRRGCRMLITRRTLTELKQPGLIARFYWGGIKEEELGRDWVVVHSGQSDEPCFDFAKLAENANRDIEGLAEWHLEVIDTSPRISPIASAWKEIVGSPVIPFDPFDRRKKLAEAFEALKHYISARERDTGGKNVAGETDAEPHPKETQDLPFSS